MPVNQLVIYPKELTHLLSYSKTVNYLKVENGYIKVSFLRVFKDKKRTVNKITALVKTFRN